MEYQALYRKYRPASFSDVVGQETTIKILTNSIKANKISHAYLFSGPRGTGKTTIAKLLAKTINCLNLKDDFSVCHECENCLDIENNSSDIIEIDAASNNGVDEIRELKSKINLVPSKLKYKVYIIDEVHMLSISAFNALLKTLEEPPSHVIFILATTEFYKVPTTIVSRCQCLTFSRIKLESLETRLQEIATKENINITSDAIHEIALYADGGLRDALGMLDKLASYSLEQITADDFLKINGLISKSDIDNFIDLIIAKDNVKVIEKLDEFSNLGYDFSKLIEKILEELRDLLVSCYTSNNKKYKPEDLSKLIFAFNETYNMLKEAANRKIIVEVKLLSFMNQVEKVIIEPKKELGNNISREIKNVEETPKTISGNNGAVVKPKETPKIKYEIDEEIKKIRIDNTFALANKNLKNTLVRKWGEIDKYLLDEKYKNIASNLKDVEIGVASQNNLILVTKYESVLERIYQEFLLTEELISKIMENNYQIVLLTSEEFNQYVKEYKAHLNDKDYYVYKEDNRPLIKNEKKTNLEIEKNEEVCYSNLVQKAIDVFGSDYVEVE